MSSRLAGHVNVQQPPHKLVSSNSIGRWPLALAFGGAFAAVLAVEWNRWPNGSPLLGPLGIIWYDGVAVETVVLCATSVAWVFAFFLKPCLVTAALSLLGALNWLFWGVVAEGIGC